jgi:hypothetical protein
LWLPQTDRQADTNIPFSITPINILQNKILLFGNVYKNLSCYKTTNICVEEVVGFINAF